MITVFMAGIQAAFGYARFGLCCATFFRQSSTNKVFTALRNDFKNLSYDINYISDQVTVANRSINAIKENPLKVGLEMMEYASNANSIDLENMYHKKAINYLLEASNFFEDGSDCKIVALNGLSLCLYYIGDYKNSLRNLDKILGYYLDGDKISEIESINDTIQHVAEKSNINGIELMKLCPSRIKYLIATKQLGKDVMPEVMKNILLRSLILPRK